MEDQKVTVLYRFERNCPSESLTNGDGTSNVRIWDRKFKVIRETPCFYIVREHGMYGKEKRVGKKTRRPFAYRTRKEALQSYIHRCNRAIALSKYQIKYAQLAQEAAKKLWDEENPSEKPYQINPNDVFDCWAP
ncbi:hypothetical protein [Arachidicoccus terrestris]|uniref:hypothetical protein n=1 Tax=Arachidicoccus terrestris TaxID=2875539 RepID=UPI001CC7C0D1|nr:hypothetical protein [Arachidicoccus terrestris]UAY56247.1 hypothetical protein K9M52_04305 [Arachidicoccus terrestris]